MPHPDLFFQENPEGFKYVYDTQANQIVHPVYCMER